MYVSFIFSSFLLCYENLFIILEPSYYFQTNYYPFLFALIVVVNDSFVSCNYYNIMISAVINNYYDRIIFTPFCCCRVVASFSHFSRKRGSGGMVLFLKLHPCHSRELRDNNIINNHNNINIIVTTIFYSFYYNFIQFNELCSRSYS